MNTLKARSGRRPAGQSHVEWAYHQLKMAIISADLPAGSPINEVAIAHDLGISRTPIREAIRQLERDGLVVRFAGRGTFVRQIEMREVMEIWQLREWLEPIGCELAARNLASESLKPLRERMAALRDSARDLKDFELFHQLDLKLHELISKASGNATLSAVLDNLNVRIVQTRMIHTPERLVEASIEHINIIDALIARDPHAAAEAMRVHLRNSREYLVSMFGASDSMRSQRIALNA